ncbi:MAG TPA: hypothetical protein VII99_11800 [Bacteroidia bacterium]
MKTFFTVAVLAASYGCSFAQLPDCDIWLFSIQDNEGVISLSDPVNITNRKGYDNQPAFSPDGNYLLFSSQRDGSNSTDIYKYDLKTKTTTRFTNTSTSEYSPTFMSGGKNISVVMVEKDSIQRVWSFPLKGGAPSCIMQNIKEIGYHCWINKDSIALNVLTKPAFTLQIADIHTQKAFVVADSAGRCMRMHDGDLWFTTSAGHFHRLYEYSPRSKTSYIKGIIESEDFCFYKNEVWSCSGNTIISGYLNSKLGAIEIANLEKFGITKPSRVTLSPDGKKLAVVSNK